LEIHCENSFLEAHLSERHFNHQDLGNWIKTYVGLRHSNQIAQRNLLTAAYAPSVEKVIGKIRVVQASLPTFWMDMGIYELRFWKVVIHRKDIRSHPQSSTSTKKRLLAMPLWPVEMNRHLCSFLSGDDFLLFFNIEALW